MFCFKEYSWLLVKNEVSVMHSNNCSMITGHKIPGAQPSFFYPFKRAKPNKNALPSHTQWFKSSVFVTRKELTQRAKPLLGTARHFCCKHFLLIHVESWTFSHSKEISLREKLHQARFKVRFSFLFFFSFFDFWYIFGICTERKCWPWNPKAPQLSFDLKIVGFPVLWTVLALRE